MSPRSGLLLCASIAGCARPVVRDEAPVAPPHEASPSATTAQFAPVAVVELFTSEGCSSCPPADDVFTELAREADPRVALLAFHVDIWDDLGHPDPFASSEHTRRQWAYSRSLGQRGVFTPQAIVSGAISHVGSEGRAIRASIAASLRRAAVATITPTITRDGERLRLAWTTEGHTSAAKLLIALTEDGLSTRVKAGENAGKTLVHGAVVRATLERDGAAGTATLMAAGVAMDRAKVVWVLTDEASGSVRGAAWRRP